jgi:hypothetical protein
LNYTSSLDLVKGASSDPGDPGSSPIFQRPEAITGFDAEMNKTVPASSVKSFRIIVRIPPYVP